jgi:hypothetical protein
MHAKHLLKQAAALAALALLALASPIVGCGSEEADDASGGATCRPAGVLACNGVCVATAGNPAHCGGCNRACSPGQVCFSGQCACGSTQTKCGDACVDAKADPKNCGGCGKACGAGLVCSLGACESECAAGLTDCSGACVDARSNAAHCGGCGQACAPDAVCNAGKCECPTGTLLCGQTCASTAADPLNCGACGKKCNANQICEAGNCIADPDAGSGGAGGSGGASGSGGSGGSTGGSGGSTGGSGGSGGSTGGTGGTGGGTGGSGGSTGGAGGSGGGTGGSGGGPVDSECTPPIQLANVSNPTAVIGTGTPGSCNEGALRTAAAQGGVITFNCGSAPHTIAITQTVNLPNDKDTVIDGGGTITLDAAKSTRIFYFSSGNWLFNTRKVTLQRLVLRNGKAPAGTYFPQNPGQPKCAYGYKEGSGGAIYMRDGILHVIDSEFYGNEAALLGPDVGGGAIYVQGSKGVVIVGSRFEGNRGANGGAVGMLFANPLIYNSVFENNTAEGVGMNYVEPGCPNFNHDEQGGAGGLAGAVYFDGNNEDNNVYTICGSVFRNNRCNELAGALFRTPNVEVRDMVIDRCTFDGNTAGRGGVSFIKQNNLTVRDTLFANNRGGVNVAGNTIPGGTAGLWVNESALTLVNTTFFNNTPGGLSVELYGGGTASARNVTFVDSASDSDVSANNSVFVNVSCGTTQGSHNVQFPQSGTCPGDTIRQDPKLGALADNGGPTRTMLPASDSPVLGIGQSCPATDQRGQPRTSSNCDSGAVER